MTENFAQQVENNLTTWAKSHHTVRSVVEVGSQVRVDHPADQWSDFDLILLITEPLQKSQANESERRRGR